MNVTRIPVSERFAKLSPEMQRYIVIGVAVYLFEVVVIVAAQYLGASSLVAVALSYWLGLLASFTLTKLITFGDKRMHHRVVLLQLALFSALVLVNFGFTLLVTDILSSVIPPFICRTLALGVTTIWNFYLYKTRIFSGDEPSAR